MSGKKKKGELRRRVVGILIILFGIGFYLFPNIREWQLKLRTQAMIREFEETYGTTVDVEGLLEADSGTAGSTAGNEKANTGTDTEDQSKTDNSSGDTNIEAETADNSGGDTNTEADPLTVLYEEMAAYNQNLIENGQQLTDAWSYEQTPVDLSALQSISGSGEETDTDSESGTETASDDDAIGCIILPAMGVVLPLYIGASTENMAKGATVLSETSMPIGGESTNCVIAGHRGYSGMPYFREIEKLEIGSFIYIINPWETLHYKVVQIEIIEPDDVDSILIVPGKDLVTLLTCHPYMSHGRYRYVVYCERVTDDEDESGEHEGTDGEEDAADADDLSSSDGDAAYVVSGGTQEVGSSEWLIVAERVIRIAVPILALIVVLVLFLKKKDDKSEDKSGSG
ncbi:MAG: class C sortase [Lachnospiraceae bacterium]|nr:class C sortase [Lachnospiraceae bacterium]